MLVGSLKDVSSAKVLKNFVVTKEVYSLKYKPKMIWNEELVVYDKYGTLLWQIYNQTNKNHKKYHHTRCLKPIITPKLMLLW